MKKSIILCLLAAICSYSAMAQDNPVRIGLKFGFPNIAGLNAEYVTPLLGGRLAPSVDFSYISAKIGDTEATFSYLSLGGNLYFKGTGKGPYAHVGYANMDFEGTYSYNNPVTGKIEGTGSLGMNFVNFKLGLKTGKRFYFRPEIGYGLLLGDSIVKVKYSDGSSDSKAVPDILSKGLLINSGFGFAF